jgi:hypothetical protein
MRGQNHGATMRAGFMTGRWWVIAGCFAMLESGFAQITVRDSVTVSDDSLGSGPSSSSLSKAGLSSWCFYCDVPSSGSGYHQNFYNDDVWTGSVNYSFSNNFTRVTFVQNDPGSETWGWGGPMVLFPDSEEGGVVYFCPNMDPLSEGFDVHVLVFDESWLSDYFLIDRDGIASGLPVPRGSKVGLYLVSRQNNNVLSPKPVELVCDWVQVLSWVGTGFSLTVEGLHTGYPMMVAAAAQDTLSRGDTTAVTIRFEEQHPGDSEPVPNPTTLMIDFSIDESSREYGDLIDPDGVSGKTAAGVSYAEACAGAVRFAANGTNPSENVEIGILARVSNNEDCPIGGYASFILRADSAFTLEVTADKDTLMRGEAAAIRVRALRKGVEITPPEGTLLRFRLDSAGSVYGTLRHADSAVVNPSQAVPYDEAHSGGIRFFADGAAPDSAALIWVNVNLSSDEDVAGRCSIAITDSMGIRFLNYFQKPASSLKIAAWADAYDKSSGMIRDDFIKYDVDRFYLQIRDRGCVNDSISAMVWTEGPDGTVIDPPNAISCLKKAEGFFQSKSQILTAENLGDINPDQEDDNYPLKGAGIDETPADRTHQARIGGKVIAEYTASNGSTLRSEINVCDSCLTGELIVYVMLEPFLDTGYKSGHDMIGVGNGEFDWEGKPDIPFRPGLRSEKYLDVSSGLGDFYGRGDNSKMEKSDGRGWPISNDSLQAHLKRANISWAPACIQFKYIRTVDVDHNFGKLLFNDYAFTIPGSPASGTRVTPNDIFPCTDFLANKGMLSQKDVMYIVIAPCKIDDNLYPWEREKMPTKKYGGVACFPSRPPLYTHPWWARDEFIAFLSPVFPMKTRSLAHEIGHLLSCIGDSPQNSWILFPQDNFPEDDSKINRFRRLDPAFPGRIQAMNRLNGLLK